MPILGIIASGISGHLFAPSGAYESIATVSVGSGGAASVTFDNIPSTYSHLQIRAIARRTGSATSTPTDWLRFNQDTGSNYTWHYLYGDGSSATAGASNPQDRAYVLFLTAGGQTANTFAVSVIDVLDYANTNKYKTIRAIGGNDNNDINGIAKFYSSAWMSTSAITRIDLDTDADDFAQYSHFALYGIKAA